MCIPLKNKSWLFMLPKLYGKTLWIVVFFSECILKLIWTTITQHNEHVVHICGRFLWNMFSRNLSVYKKTHISTFIHKYKYEFSLCWIFKIIHINFFYHHFHFTTYYFVLCWIRRGAALLMWKIQFSFYKNTYALCVLCTLRTRTQCKPICKIMVYLHRYYAGDGTWFDLRM